MRLQVETPGARPAEKVLADAMASFGCHVLGGASEDGWSKCADLQRCPYRYYLKHVLRADPPDGGTRTPLEIGSLTHGVLATHYARRLPEGYPGWQPGLPSAMDLLDRMGELGADVSNLAVVRRLVYGYIEHYGDEDIQPVAIEYGAGIPGTHTCRYDMLAWKDGALWNFEHKTASNDNATVTESWWLDGEILGEIYAYKLSRLQEVFGAQLAGVVINMLVKTHPPRFRRLEIVVPQKVIDSYVRDRHFWNQFREQCHLRGHWPRKLQGCSSRYDLCAYWGHCRDEDATLLQIRRPDHV